MKRKSDILPSFLLALCIAAFASCNIDMPCQEKTDVFLRAQLCRIDSTGKEVNLQTRISLKACDNDSLWYNEKQLSLLEIPLKPNADESDFEISIQRDSIWHHDVLSIYHENERFFLSMECGAIVKHKITGTEIRQKDNIKEVVILQELIDNKTETHLKIYVE